MQQLHAFHLNEAGFVQSGVNRLLHLSVSLVGMQHLLPSSSLARLCLADRRPDACGPPAAAAASPFNEAEDPAMQLWKAVMTCRGRN